MSDAETLDEAASALHESLDAAWSKLAAHARADAVRYAARSTVWLSPASAARFARDRSAAVRVAVVFHPLAPDELVDRLRNDRDKKVADAADLVWLRRHPALVEPRSDREARLALEEPGARRGLVRWQVLSWPTLSGEMIGEIFDDELAEGRVDAGFCHRIAEHPNTPRRVIDQLVGDRLHWWDRALGHPRCAPELIVELLTEFPKAAIDAAISNPALTVEVADFLADLAVRTDREAKLAALVANPHLPEPSLTRIAVAATDDARRATLLAACCCHPSATRDTAAKVPVRALVGHPLVAALTLCCDSGPQLKLAYALATDESSDATCSELAAVAALALE